MLKTKAQRQNLLLIIFGVIARIWEMKADNKYCISRFANHKFNKRIKATNICSNCISITKEKNYGKM